MLSNGLALIAILWLAADGVGGNPPDPMIAMFAFATMASFELLMPIAGAFQYLGQTLTSARRLNEIITATPDVEFPLSGELTSTNFDIQLNDIFFRYPDAENNAINGLTLNVEHQSMWLFLAKPAQGNRPYCNYSVVTGM